MQANIFYHNNEPYFILSSPEGVDIYTWNETEESLSNIQNFPKFLYVFEYFEIDGTPWFAFDDDDKVWVYEWDGIKFEEKRPIMGSAQTISPIYLNNTLYLILTFSDNGTPPAKIYEQKGTLFKPSSYFQLPSDKELLKHTFKYNDEQFFVFFNDSESIPEQGETFEIDRWNGEALEKVYAGTTNSYWVNSFPNVGKQFVTLFDESEEGLYESIYEWRDNQLYPYQTIPLTNDIEEYVLPKYFTIDGKPYLIVFRSDLPDFTSPLYEWESSEAKEITLSDVICALQVLSGKQCNFQPDDVIVDMKDVLQLLSEISR